MTTTSSIRLASAMTLVVAMAAPAVAQDVGSLVTFRADNRSGSEAAAAVIAEMIAERSQSAAVQSRARSLSPRGALELGPTELLLDIGAQGYIERVSLDAAGAQPAVARRAQPQPARVEPVSAPEPARVEPVSAPATVSQPARVEPAPPATTTTSAQADPAPALVPSTAAAASRPAATSSGRNWTAGGGATAVNDRGNEGTGSGGGGGGWN